mmetsp:Transcript_19041/g.45737  ORF Transcript_19041/g.45737 Transcript_19041/m.45737 type:complete len:263 (-) Transcript_19041:1612-2400(-)
MFGVVVVPFQFSRRWRSRGHVDTDREHGQSGGEHGIPPDHGEPESHVGFGGGRGGGSGCGRKGRRNCIIQQRWHDDTDRRWRIRRDPPHPPLPPGNIHGKRRRVGPNDAPQRPGAGGERAAVPPVAQTRQRRQGGSNGCGRRHRDGLPLEQGQIRQGGGAELGHGRVRRIARGGILARGAPPAGGGGSTGEAANAVAFAIEVAPYRRDGCRRRGGKQLVRNSIIAVPSAVAPYDQDVVLLVLRGSDVQLVRAVRDVVHDVPP